MGRPAHFSSREVIRKRERVEDDSEPCIEKPVEGEHGNSHGVNDVKVGIQDYTCSRSNRLMWVLGFGCTIAAGMVSALER
mgnify:FL=1